MEKFEKAIEDFCQNALRELRGELVDQNKLKHAQDWYKRFTGKEYVGNPRELVEMFKIVNEPC
jgi:hypothetical protein